MTFLSNRTVDHLRQVSDLAELPDLAGPRYEIVGEIGRGGMGTVYLAQDRHLMRQVALKVLSVEALGEDARARLIREARILARLEHPGIVPVHDVGWLADGRIYYSMKRVQGQRLDEHLQRTTGLRERLRIFERLCEAVAFAHARGVIHRDLKPSNVMVGPFGEVLVMDWGVAKIVSELAGGAKPTSGAADSTAGLEVAGLDEVETLPPAQRRCPSEATRPGTILGTPGYMSPEQAAGRSDRVDHRSDVYALGVLLQELCEGADEPAPKRLRAIRDRALHAEPGARYPAVAQLAADVLNYLDGAPVSAYREGPLDLVGRWFQRYRAAILLILTYLVVRALVLFFAGT
ncbi:MAG TPA: serine/threonine-protein kinase [Acidobacteriota bacterium]